MARDLIKKAKKSAGLNAILYPNDPNVYDSLGEINLKMNKTAESRKYYQRVLDLQPSNENAKQILSQLK